MQPAPAAQVGQPAKLQLTQEVLNTFALGKVFTDNSAPINAISFSDDGNMLATSGEDDTINVYSVQTATLQKTVHAKRHGASLVRFTHSDNSLLVASKNGFDDTIRYLSVHDNRYLREFKGHRGRVTSLEMCFTDDNFLSGSMDGTVRLWDLRTNVCQGLLRCGSRPCVAYDPSGMVFAVLANRQLALYDARNFQAGSFLTSLIAPSPQQAAAAASNKVAAGSEFVSLCFSRDGKYILAADNGTTIYLMDAFEGGEVRRFTGRSNPLGSAFEASFSPDAQFVLSGSADNSVRIWNTATGAEAATWSGHTAAPHCVRWNPSKMMVASACSKLGFWIPKL